jgi:hypothetical protein
MRLLRREHKHISSRQVREENLVFPDAGIKAVHKWADDKEARRQERLPMEESD